MQRVCLWQLGKPPSASWICLCVSCSWHTHIQTHINYFCRIITTFEASTSSLPWCWRSFCKAAVFSARDTEMFIVSHSKGEKRPRRLERLLSARGSEYLLKTNVTAIPDASQNKTKTCTERIIKSELRNVEDWNCRMWRSQFWDSWINGY